MGVLVCCDVTPCIVVGEGVIVNQFSKPSSQRSGQKGDMVAALCYNREEQKCHHPNHNLTLLEADSRRLLLRCGDAEEV